MSGTLGKVHFSGIYDRIRAKDLDGADKLVGEAFADPGITEPELAQICDLIFYSKADKLYGHLGEFCTRYPASVFGAKALLATLLAAAGRPDTATVLAREHLRALRDRGALEKLAEAVPLMDGGSRAFLLLTGAYVLAGARSYALRVLDQGRPRCAEASALGLDCLKAFDRQADALENELNQPALAERDRKWEAFFARGENARELIGECKKLKLEALARRVELLSDLFTHDPQFEADADEPFLLVMTGKKKGDDDSKLIQFLG